MKKEIILIGGGGHAESMIDSIHTMNQFKIIGILDSEKKTGTEISGVPIIGNDSDLSYYFHMGIRNAVIAVGSTGDAVPRKKLFELCRKTGYQFPNIIDKSSVLPHALQIGEGNFIGKGVIINSRVRIGDACIFNTGSILEHGCTIEDFVHIAPGCVLCGNVRVKADSHIGAHSVIIQNVTIGNDTIIGAGSLVLYDIASGQVAYGSPAQEVRSNE